MAHKIIEEIEQLKWNKDKVQKWLSYGLSPKYGLSAELTMYMYKLYHDSSGDSSYVGRYNCSACQMAIYQRLNDFINYGDNIGKPLLNWEKKPSKKVDEITHIKKKTITKKDEE